jgi:hypothetical protein
MGMVINWALAEVYPSSSMTEGTVAVKPYTPIYRWPRVSLKVQHCKPFSLAVGSDSPCWPKT